MYIKNLRLHNIGPFRDARLSFSTPGGGAHQPVTVITGTNGAGKSIIIDAIRTALCGQRIERDIVADSHDFSIGVDAIIDGAEQSLSTSRLSGGNVMEADWANIARYLTVGYEPGDTPRRWVVDYWSSRLPTDAFRIDTIRNIDHRKTLAGVLQGKKSNIDLVNFICYADYLRSSDVGEEREAGETLYAEVKEIVNLCLDGGEFRHVRRTDITPVVSQNGHDVSLEKLSSGNIFLIEHFLLLLCKMFSVSVLCGMPAAEARHLGGLLLVDEIENHLHPRWQKRVLGMIRQTFPNLQLIVTTHSPFVVGSMSGMTTYTCVPQAAGSEVRETTQRYDTKPVDEVLASEVFDVLPFNADMTRLYERRQREIEAGHEAQAEATERELYEKYPDSFSFLFPLHHKRQA